MRMMGNAGEVGLVGKIPHLERYQRLTRGLSEAHLDADEG